MTLRRHLAALTAVVALTGGVVACSSDDENSDSTTDAADTSTAPEAMWSSYHGIDVPKGEQGPDSADPVRHQYEQSPQGAVLAAINGQAQMALADEKSFPDVSRYNLAPGKGRDQWVQGRTLANVEGDVEPKDAPAFKGFRIDDYDDDKTIVVLATDYPESGLMAYPVQLNWMNNDWRIVAPPQDAEVTPVAIESLDGFTEFSAPTDDQEGN